MSVKKARVMFLDLSDRPVSTRFDSLTAFSSTMESEQTTSPLTGKPSHSTKGPYSGKHSSLTRSTELAVKVKGEVFVAHRSYITTAVVGISANDE